MIGVLPADDEAMVRAGVRAVLGSSGETEVVAEAGDGREAVEPARAHRPDVALLDLRMPRLDGLAAAEEIARAVPGTAVAMLTAFSERSYVARALGGGATGFRRRRPHSWRGGWGRTSRRAAGTGEGRDGAGDGAARTFLRDHGLEHLTAHVRHGRGQRRKGRDREGMGVGAPGPPPGGHEQRDEDQQSGLRSDLGRVLYPRGRVLRVVGAVAVGPAVHKAHGHGP
ncbi:CheY-like chemotaxis protein [Streptomyces calvus]